MAGVVPLIVDYAGPGELVVPGTGYKIPIAPRDRLVAAFRAQLTEILDDPSGLAAMGQAAQARARTLFSWPAKAAQVAEVYDWVLGRAEKPAPWFEAGP